MNKSLKNSNKKLGYSKPKINIFKFDYTDIIKTSLPCSFEEGCLIDICPPDSE